MRIEIVLVGQIILLEFFGEKLHERQWNNQWDHSLMVLINYFKYLLLFQRDRSFLK